MNEQEILRQQIDAHLIEHSLERGKPGEYKRIGDLFGVSSEYIRERHRRLRKKGYIKDYFAEDGHNTWTGESSFKEDLKSGSADITTVTNSRIKTLDDLIRVCEIDVNTWNIDWWICNKWEVGAKNDQKKLIVEPLFQVKAKLSRRKVDTDLPKQKEAILAELKAFAPDYDIINRYHDLILSVKTEERKFLYELSLSDHHFGKLSWSPESGEDYDIKIAEQRWKAAIRDLLSKVDLNTIERFLLPLGNDMFHVDSKSNETTAGTGVDVDSRFFKMVKVVKRILIETIDDLTTIAPVDVVVIPGNHDYHSSLWMGEVLDAWYHKNEAVTIDIEPKTRKYYQYGRVGIQLTHGNEEKHNELGGLFAIENKEMWYHTDFHYCQIGHFHKSKKMQYLDVDEHAGFQVEIVPSLSATDGWHHRKGYASGKAAKSFLFHARQGKVGEFYYNHPKS